jgi:NAD+ kinase
MPDIKVVGLIAKPGIPHASAIVPKLVHWLKERGVDARLDQEAAIYLGRTDGLPRAAVAEGAQLVIVLGGDGTLLSAARAVAGREIPLLPVNLGGLGFLTAITLDQLYPELERAFKGELRVVPRRMLHGDLVRRGQIVKSYEALNDVVIAKTQFARMIDLDVYVDTQFVSTFKADGLIVATPTGSTAYSLSAGGPIVFPAVSDNEAFLTVDGQVGEHLLHEDHVVCKRSEHQVHLVRPPAMFFFDVLRQKLKWGER